MRYSGPFVLLLCSAGFAAAQTTAHPRDAQDPTEEILAMSMAPNAPFGQDTAPPPASTSRPVRISGGVMAGQILTRVDPVYPAEARSKGQQGAVVLSARIARDGTVAELTLISGPAALGQAAQDAVRQWTYKPFLLNGQPTDVLTTITVNFHLNSRDTGQPQK